MPVAAPADKRFRRSHVSPRRRRPFAGSRWRKAGIVTGIALSLVVLVDVGVRTLLASKSLTITTIRVEGTERMPEGVVREELADLLGQPMFSARLDEWRDRVLRLSWVADASVRRVLPGTVTVTVMERQPMAIGRIGDTLSIIDRRGVIIDAFGPSYKDLDLPIVDGLAYGSEGELGALEQSRALLAVRLLADIQHEPDLTGRLSQVDVSDERDAVVVLQGDTTLLHLGDARFAERLRSYLDLLPTLREDTPNADSVDLRFGSRVFVRPSGRAILDRTKGIGGEE
jgi:cell division protein FtsQ